MTKTITAAFRSLVWEESELATIDGLAKMTRASCRQRYEGDIDGESVLEYTMIYGEAGAASFVGLERIQGVVLGRSGSFVLRHIGRFEGGTAKMQLEVIEGVGTGALAGLRARGAFESPHAESYTVTLDVEAGLD